MDRIDAMQAFVAVADLKGFAPAARKLGVSPSGVTRLVAALEDRLGARLLQRTTRSVTLTDVGTRYLVRARRILADVEEAEGSTQDERTRPNGRLAVSAPVGFGRLHVSPVMSAYLTRFPMSAANCGCRIARSIWWRRASISRSGLAIFPIPAWWRAMSARCGGSWSPPATISSSAASRRRRRQLHRMKRYSSAPSAPRRSGALSGVTAKSTWRAHQELPPTAPTPRSSMPNRTAA